MGVHVDARVPTLGQIYKNNIVVNNTVGLEVDFASAPNNPTWTNNLVFGNGTDYSGIANPTGSLGNISVDPLFVNVANSDYRLQSNSPAIDVGDNTALQLPQTDYVSNPRIVDANNDCVSAVDIGAYEFLRTANASLSTNALIFAGQPIGTSSNAQTVTLSNTGATCFQLSSIGITGDFSQGTNCAAAGVPAGSSCAFSVTFTPTAIGSRLGALTVNGQTAPARRPSTSA